MTSRETLHTSWRAATLTTHTYGLQRSRTRCGSDPRTIRGPLLQQPRPRSDRRTRHTPLHVDVESVQRQRTAQLRHPRHLCVWIGRALARLHRRNAGQAQGSLPRVELVRIRDTQQAPQKLPADVPRQQIRRRSSSTSSRARSPAAARSRDSTAGKTGPKTSAPCRIRHLRSSASCRRPSLASVRCNRS